MNLLIVSSVVITHYAIIPLIHVPQCQYFAHEHLIRPILHRPTFEAMVKARVHEKDQYFGGLVLMVCACGSRWSNDPRTRTKDDMPNSAGWLYYEQVHRLQRPMNEPVSLVRLQLYNVSEPCVIEGLPEDKPIDS